MPSEAQKRASAKYERENITKMTFKFNKRTDADILEMLNRVPNRQGYLKDLIRQDIERRSR